jgi:hypothetical protein
MIVNRGFETGDFTGWTYSGSCAGNTEGHVHYDYRDAKSSSYYNHGTCRKLEQNSAFLIIIIGTIKNKFL